MEPTDRRVQTRAQLFVIRKDHEQIPVFALRASDDINAVPGLVMDLSNAGVQVLTSSKASIVEGSAYSLELASGQPLDADPIHRIPVQLMWSREDGMYIRCGFTFTPESADSDLQRLQSRVTESDHGLLRCVLHPKI